LKKSQQNALDRLVRDLVSRGSSFSIKVTGWSMEPSIMEGEDVLIESPFGRTRTGDVVLFRMQGKYVIHRVVFRAFDRLLVKGDALKRFDGMISEKDVIGRMRRPGPAAAVTGRARALISLAEGALSAVKGLAK
jgi:hypothetical protein